MNNLPVTDTEILEALQSDYEEQQAILKEMAIISACEAALNEQRKAEKPKYVRVAREYLSALRDIYHKGHSKNEARELIEVLELESTVPMSELELPFRMVDGIYQQVDSYTGESLEKFMRLPVSAAASQWDKDFEEVQAVAEIIEEIDQEGLIPEASFDIIEPLVMVAVQPSEPQSCITEATIVVNREESLEVRIVQEMRKMGYSDKEIDIALASQYIFDDPEEDAPSWETDVRTSGPVEAMAEDRPGFAQIGEARRLLNSIARLRAKIAEWQAELMSFPVGYLPKDKYIEKMKLQGKLSWLQGKLSEVEMEVFVLKPQTLAIVALSDEELEFIAPYIKIATYGTLGNFIDLFGDDILEDTMFGQEPVGEWFMMGQILIQPSCDEWQECDPRIDALAAETIDQIVELQFDPDPVKDGKPDIENSRAFARGVFHSLAAGEAELRSAGYSNWRREKSPKGAMAYNMAMDENKEKPWAERIKLSMRAFWNACTIKGLLPSGLRVVKTNGQEEVVNYNLAKWKLEHGEIILTSAEKERLKSMLQGKHWGAKFVSIL